MKLRYLIWKLCLLSLPFAGCHVFKPSVEVAFHTKDSTRFYVLPVKFFEQASNGSMKVDFMYDQKKDWRAVVTCSFTVENETEEFTLQHVEISGGEITYQAASFDRQPSRKKGKKFIHRLSFYIPQDEFGKLMKSAAEGATEATSMKIKVNGSVYRPKEKKWSKLGREITGKQLLP